MSVSSPPSKLAQKSSIKSLDKELETLKNRIRRLELQESNAQALERVTNKKMAQLVSKKIIVEEMLPLKHKDRESIIAEIETKKWENQQSRAERQEQVRNIKQALYMVKRDRAQQLYLEKMQNRILSSQNKKQMIRLNQDRYEQIKNFKSHQKYLQFMRGKLIKARIQQNINHYKKDLTEVQKNEEINRLKQQESFLKQRVARSASRTLQAKKEFSAVYQLPRNQLLSKIKKTIDPKEIIELDIEMSPKDESRSVDFKHEKIPRTNLPNQTNFQKILRALRKKNKLQ